MFLGLAILTLGALIFFGTDLLSSQTDGESVGQVEDPTVEGAPENISEDAGDEESADEEEAADEGDDEDSASDEDEPIPVAPDDPTMSLSVPKLGISGAIVAGGETGLELGAQLVSGAPWQPGSNTYIAGHRVGFPGTGSDHIFYSLPAMSQGDEITLTDSLGQEYTYRVSEVFTVTPFDTWVMDPGGDDMISLQVCTETPDDWWTIGPSLMSSGPESGRLIVRAEKV
ncbi:MAG: sortase [Actinobacteria bacterium]|nr:sortase [Actinomycetota bacterium]